MGFGAAGVMGAATERLSDEATKGWTRVGRVMDYLVGIGRGQFYFLRLIIIIIRERKDEMMTRRSLAGSMRGCKDRKACEEGRGDACFRRVR